MATAYASQVATLLFCNPRQIQCRAKGRLVRFDVTEPDPRFSTGPVQTRVLRYLTEYPQPITLGKLAAVVDTRCERVQVKLKHLMDAGKVIAHDIDDDITEYTLAQSVWLV